MERILLRRVSGEDLGSLGRGEAFCKVGDAVFNLTTYDRAVPGQRDLSAEISRRSRQAYAANGDERARDFSKSASAQAQDAKGPRGQLDVVEAYDEV